MAVLAIDHIQLAMPPGEEILARCFYSDLLGLAEMPKPPVLAARGGCWFEGNSVKVHLGVETDFRPARKAHPAFLVDDLFALTIKLEDAGFAVARDEPLAGYDRCHVADPFGNRIELMQKL